MTEKTPLSQPEVIREDAGLKIVWKDENILATVTRINAHTDGRIIGELLLKTNNSGKNSHLHRAPMLNFTSSIARKNLAKVVSERYSGTVQWNDLIEQVSEYTINFVREGEPVVELWNTDQIPPLEYQVWPIVLKDDITAIYGDGGSGKSLLALLLGIMSMYPEHDYGLGLVPQDKSVRILYLDWETNRNSMLRRLARLCHGCGVKLAYINYRRCFIPLADDMEQVKDYIRKCGATMLIIDSVGLAAGGDIGKPEQAIRFMAAVRSANLTTILINHVTKEKESSKTQIGSVYFRNLARGEWYVKSNKDELTKDIDVGLFHTKMNDDEFSKPLGFHFHFENDAIKVTKQSVETIKEILDEMNLSEKILACLKRGAMNAKEIAEETGTKEPIVRSTCDRMEKKNMIVKIKQNGIISWGLIQRGLD